MTADMAIVSTSARAAAAPAAAARRDIDRFERAFERAAGAALTTRNTVRLLLDAE
jgi:hypothetical protein